MADFENFEDFEELEAMFGQGDSDLKKMEKVILTQNLDGFASCFPDWDLHPPIRKQHYQTTRAGMPGSLFIPNSPWEISKYRVCVSMVQSMNGNSMQFRVVVHKAPELEKQHREHKTAFAESITGTGEGTFVLPVVLCNKKSCSRPGGSSQAQASLNQTEMRLFLRTKLVV